MYRKISIRQTPNAPIIQSMWQSMCLLLFSSSPGEVEAVQPEAGPAGGTEQSESHALGPG